MIWLLCFSLLAVSLEAFASPPNVVLIVVDDGAYMDFGGYGGEASTPTIDGIADAGVRFSNYHTSPLCAPSRAMLLTGVDNHRTGVGTIPEVVTEAQSTQPGYSMSFRDEIETLADKLRASGYRTYMTGKWHLGSGDGDLPDSHGFDRSFALDASGADNWEQKSFLPFYGYAPWFEDGRPADLPDDFYSSKFIVDQMIHYLESGDPGQPFFSFVSFQAIHIPVQAPREFTDRYKGVYSGGWDELLKKRFERAQALGLVPRGSAPPQMHPSLRRWESLPAKEQAWFERAMMVNAGMLEAMDFHVGRLVRHLKAQEMFDDTVFVITSDNGPEFGLPTASRAFRLWMWANGYDDDLERLGEKGSMVAIGPEWASATSSPGSLFKFYATEGGTRVPLIISGPGVSPDVSRRGFHSAMSFATDVTPTILSLAGVPDDVRNRGEPMTGRTLSGVLDGTQEEAHPKHEPIGMEVSGNAWLYKGGHKLVKNSLPHGDGRWHLYDVPSDPAETRDLSKARPELAAELLRDYEAYAASMGVLATPADFDIVAQVGRNTLGKLLERNRAALLGMLIFLTVGLGFGIRAIRR